MRVIKEILSGAVIYLSSVKNDEVYAVNGAEPTNHASNPDRLT
jgi:hypothetical protein